MSSANQPAAKSAETKSWRLNADAPKRNSSPGHMRVTSDLVHETPVPVPVPKATQGGRLSLPPSVPRPIPSHGVIPPTAPKRMLSNLLSQHRRIMASQQGWEKVQTGNQENSILVDSDSDSDTDSDSDAESEQGRKTETPVPLPSGVLNKANELSTNHSKSHSETHAKQPAQDNQKVSPDSSIYSVTGSEMEQRGKSPSENSLPPLEEVATAAQLMERVRKEHLSEFNSSASPDTAPRSRVRATTPRSSGTHDQPSGTVFAIRKATSGRPYNEYWDHNGDLISTRGAILPDGYKEHGNPEYPFICPVRDCRRIFTQLFSLSGHFGPGHRNATFNDNGDGTLTQVGTYKNSSGPTPCIVVSRNPLPPDAPPMAEPSLPVAAAYSAKRRVTDSLFIAPPQAKKRATDAAVQAPSASSSSVSLSAWTPVDIYSDTINPLDYLFSVLRPNHPRYGRSDIDRLSKLRFLRRLPEAWLRHHGNKALDVHNFACALAFIVGKKETGTQACHKTAEVKEALLSGICVGLSGGAPAVVKAAFSSYTTCVGCNYLAHATGRRNDCEWSEEKVWKEQGITLATGVDGDYGPPGHWQLTNSTLPRESKQPDYATLRERVAKLPSPTADTLPADSSVEATLASSRERRRMTRPQGLYGNLPSTDNTPNAQTQATNSQPAGAGTFQTGQFGAENYEMEDWEIAPGRVTNANQSQNIAYSGTFLTSSVPITISPDICFNVHVLLPGKTINVTAQKDKFQVFSVAAGKVKVKVDEQTIQLGPNGAFPLRPGVGCVIENRLYFNAVVHCTTVKEYEMEHD